MRAYLVKLSEHLKWVKWAVPLFPSPFMRLPRQPIWRQDRQTGERRREHKQYINQSSIIIMITNYKQTNIIWNTTTIIGYPQPRLRVFGRRNMLAGADYILEGTKGGPKEWGSQITTGLIVFYSQLFTCSNPHAHRCSNRLPWDPLSSPSMSGEAKWGRCKRGWSVF